MPTIFCSARLSTFIGVDRLHPIQDIPLNHTSDLWNAQMFTVARRKAILVTNKLTLYSFIRLNVLKRDLADPGLFFMDSFLIQATADNLLTEAKASLFPGHNSSIVFCTTDNDKKVIGSMNDAIHQLKTAVELNVKSVTENFTDVSAGSYVNNLIMGLLNYDRPVERLRKSIHNA